MSISVRDNYGGRWMKEITNLIRNATINGIKRKKLYRLLYLQAGLRVDKITEYLSDLAYIELIKEENNIIYWINQDEEPNILEEKKETIKNLHKEYEEYFDKCKLEGKEPQPYDIWLKER